MISPGFANVGVGNYDHSVCIMIQSLFVKKRQTTGAVIAIIPGLSKADP